jgi:hypothetical protein
LLIAGPTLAPTNTAAETRAAKAAAILFETFVNILISFSFKTGLRCCVSEDVSYFAQAVPVFDYCYYSDI